MKNSKFLKILLSVNAVIALENKTEELPAGCRWTEWVNSDHPSKIDEFSSIDGKLSYLKLVRGLSDLRTMDRVYGQTQLVV